jgi:hypothetical protein
MSPDLTTYRRELILALRMREVPGDRIGEIVAEVESHLADTGEDPREAFGPAKEYAASVSGRPRVRWGWADALIAVAAGAAGWLVAGGVLALVSGDPLGPLPAWAAIALGVALAVPTVRHVRRSASAVLDPRTGEDLVPLPRWVPWAIAGSLALPVVIGAVVIAVFS